MKSVYQHYENTTHNHFTAIIQVNLC